MVRVAALSIVGIILGFCLNFQLPTTKITNFVGQGIFIASPKTLNIAEIGTALGYKHMESHFAYVHRSLTREIAVFQKEVER